MIFYHGTRRPFRKGGLLIPRSRHGGAGTAAPMADGATAPADAQDFVYVTTNPIVAWVYAWHAPGRGRPRVLTVRPLSEVWHDPEHSPAMEAYRCESAVVASVDLDPKIDEYEAAAGWVNPEESYA